MTAGDGQAGQVWQSLAPRLIHPIRLAILEAMLWVERPLSASELAALFDDNQFYLGAVSYHLKVLADAGIVEIHSTRQVRGALESFYSFPTMD